MKRLSAIRRALRWLAGGIAIVVLAGWFFGIPVLKSFHPHFVSMKFNVALMLLLALAASSLFGRLSESRTIRWAYWLLLAVVLAGSLATLGEDLFGWRLGIDQLLVGEPEGQPGTPIPGRPAMGGVLCLIAWSTSLALMPFGRFAAWAQWIALGGCLIAYRTIIGYLLGASEFYSFGEFTDMALSGSIAHLALGSAILLTRTNRGFMATVWSPGPGGVMMRWLAPSVMVAIVIIGWISRMGEWAALYDAAYASSLVILGGSLVVILAVHLAARWLDRVDLERTESMRQLRNAMDRLRGVQDKMVEQARLRAMGEMASGVAHDFNNALSPILGFSEALLEWPETLNNRRETLDYLRTIRQAAEDAAKTVARLRQFYSPPGGDKPAESNDINRLVADAIVLTRPMWRNRAQAEGRAIEVVAEPGPLKPVVCNADEVREVLLNLIMNSVDALPEGGKIAIRTRQVKSDVVIEVGDNGVGMAEEVRRRCLEPFFSTKGRTGTGLGLSMVAAIVLRMGGNLQIDSRPGEGTTVTIRFPRGARRGHAVGPTLVGKWKKALRILVVDDEPRIVRLLSGFLRRDGHRVTSAQDGIAALDEFHSGTYDLVITDRVMPRMTGDELTDAVKRLKPTCRVILVSGIESAPAPGDAAHAPPDFRLEKPFTMATLRDAIGRVMSAAQS